MGSEAILSGMATLCPGKQRMSGPDAAMTALVDGDTSKASIMILARSLSWYAIHPQFCARICSAEAPAFVNIFVFSHRWTTYHEFSSQL